MTTRIQAHADTHTESDPRQVRVTILMDYDPPGLGWSTGEIQAAFEDFAAERFLNPAVEVVTQ